MDGTITIPTELEVANRALRRLADELTAELRTKRPDGTVNICVGTRFQTPYVGLFTSKHDYAGTYCNGETIEAAVGEARRRIEKMQDARTDALAKFAEAKAALVAAGIDPAEAA